MQQQPYSGQTYQQAQPYTGQSYQQQQPYSGQSYQQAQPDSGEKFQLQGSPYNDLWAAVLWFLSLIIVIAGAFLQPDSTPSSKQSNITTTPYPAQQQQQQHYDYSKIIAFTFLATGVGLVLSVPLHYLTRRYAEQLIYFGNITYITLLAAVAVWSFAKGIIFSGVVLFIFTLFYVIWFYYARDRIPFAAICLRTSADICDQYKATFLNAFAWLVFLIGFALIWSKGVYNTKNGVDTQSVVPWVWLLLFYWTTQVISGIVHVTTCGVVAMWYFTGNAMPMPVNPTLGALRRATTFSLGSICFGSLLVAIIKVLRAMVRQAMRGENEFVRCIVMCIVNFIDSLVQYFNDYAFVHVAVYGKPYIQSAKDTWALVENSAVLPLINDQLLQMVYIMFILGGGLVTGVICLVACGMGMWEYFVLGLLIGMVVISMICGIVQSGVMTIFVCYAEQPQALQQVNPAFYNAIGLAMAGVSTQQLDQQKQYPHA